MQITSLFKNKKALVILCIVLLIGAVVLFIFWREAIFSKEILKIEILGPESAKVGDEVEYTVKYKNNGNFALENPKLIFELPDHTINEDGKVRFEETLKDIYPGNEETMTFRGRLIGKEGDLKSARAILTYTPHNLTVRYESRTTFTTKLESVPITFTYDLPSKIEKGKEITYSINYFSNVDYPLENLSIKIDRTSGFELASATPSSLDNTEWKLDTLTKGKGGRITIKGMVQGDAGGKLSFVARIGMWQSGIFVTIKEVTQDVEIIQPLLYISQEINGSSNYTASPGETLNYRIFLRNIGTSSFDNLFVLSRLDGQALDLSTLSSPDGQVQSNDNLIVFDSRQIGRLQHLAPQQEVSVDFSVKVKGNWDVSGADQNNAVIKNKVNVFDVSAEFTTKINSKVELSQKVYHAATGGIENSGPVPPEVGQTTTYVVTWHVKNSQNNVKNVKVKATLPDNVLVSDAISPEQEAAHFSLDSASHEMVWLAGNMNSNAETSLSFKIVLTPAVYQRGLPAKLINQATVIAEDQFTGVASQSTAPAVDTRLPDDPDNSGGGIVK